MSISAQTRRLVEQRAGGRCEYCLLPEFAEPFEVFHVEHVVARQHGGGDSPDNLALACGRCNCLKGANLTSVDTRTKCVVPLFNPRQQVWREHFVLRAGRIVGTTSEGRATVRLLTMNAQSRLRLRKWLIVHGLF